MPSFRRLSSFILPIAFVALGPSCADEEDGFGGSPEGGAPLGGQAEGGGGAPSDGGAGGIAEGGQPQGGSPTGGAPVGGGEEGGSGGEGGGSGLDPDLFPFESESNDVLGMANGLPDGAVGFQAELDDLNDIDVFSVFVPLGSTFGAAVTDGIGGCPAGANVTLQIYSPANLEIATLTGLCPALDGVVDPDLTTIDQEGTYFVRVSTTAAVPFYVLEIDVAPPVCGDGIVQLGEECDDGNLDPVDGCEPDCTQTPVCGDGTVQTGEECDDGNVLPDDGCDAVCLLEGDYCPEAEPNNTTGTATLITTCEGGYGEITVAGDIDYFEVPVAIPGSSIRVQTVDITGTGCPTTGSTGFDSVIRLYSPGGAELGTNDQGGFSPCSLIDPANATYAQNLSAGNYFVSVEEYLNNATSPPYVVLIDVLPPGCGDAVLQMGEECDDGNVVDGDGCDALCVVEGNFCGELELNDSVATATSIAACDGGFGAIQPSGDKDFYAVEVTVPFSSISARVSGTNGTTCGGVTSTLKLYNAAGTQLGSDVGTSSTCSRIDPTLDAFTRNLDVGMYYISVEENGNNATTPTYLLHVDVNPPGCGDGTVQPMEDCDDGNLINGDGCSDICEVEGSYCVETRPNDAYTLATVIDQCDGGAGSISYITDVDWYVFDVAVDGSSVELRVTDLVGTGCPTGFSSLIRFYGSNSNGTLGPQLGSKAGGGVGSCSYIDPTVPANSYVTNLAAGTYYVRVEENGNDNTSLPYVLQVDVRPPACGDTFLQMGEECDDGNTVDGDGCDATCVIEYCDEIEPNGTTATANSLSGCTGFFGAVNAVADQDYFSFEVTVPGSSVYAETTGLSGTTCVGIDTQLRLFDSAGTDLGNDNDDGDGSCSWIRPSVDAFARNLAVGTYYIRVEESGNNATTQPWLLHLSVNPPGCGDGILDASEDCDDANQVDGDGCPNTCVYAPLMCGPTETLVQLASTDLPTPIPDVGTGTSTINVATMGTVTKAAAIVDIEHLYTADVDLTLRSPNNTTIELSTDNGSSGDHFTNTHFTDDAATAITDGVPPYNGSYQPEQPFSGFNGGPANGNWLLTATDDLSGIAGNLHEFTLLLCVQP